MLPALRADQFEDIRKTIEAKIREEGLGNLMPSLANPYVHEIVEQNYKKYFKDDPAPVMGIFNDFGQRSDDFKKDHGNKLHVLYAGCSYTYAEGVPIEFSWSAIVNDYINKNIADTSGYFNIGKGGANLAIIENQIMGYMKYAGKPDIIFVNLPDIGREHLEYRVQMQGINDVKINSGKDVITILRLAERLKNLIIVCDLLKIKLFLGCWALNLPSFNDIVSKFGNPFENIDVINLSGEGDVVFTKANPNHKHQQLVEQEMMRSIPEDSPLRNIMHIALDDAHPGLIGHRIMADNFIIELEEWYKSQIVARI